MSGVNRAIIVGNLGGDPEVRRTQDGRPIVSFSVATSDTWRDKATGERKENTQWHRIVIFSEPLCKVAEQYLKKGSKVYLEGKMQTRDWEHTDGSKRYVTEVVLQAFHSNLQLLDRAGGGVPPNDGSSDDATRYGPAPSRAAGGRNDDMNDDIPF